ncbi:response regulator receiver protein [Solidesulfovibrio fructosivorans JJ]]|uniref:endopeptidase La n=1 Tax=Solidesulfovibrio fructosivorans JJ] TaxID=596151 RepID=E1JTL7_SOLFR|nr:S16 family serine protease [Solidesulfovibrio fructosivorans]EFL52146.1 response regulator receiver protein [Solidesulfovibrio fructosivorans JJ]]
MFFRNKPRQAEPAAPNAAEADTGVLETLRRSVEDANLPAQAADAAGRELERLEKTDPSVAEYAVGINYLEFLLKLPWNNCTRDTLDLTRAREVLDARHHGLTAVKERILEFLAARALRGAAKPKLLVVDDEEIARMNMAHVLGKEGYEVRTAGDGLEALDVLTAGFAADVVVTDLKMERLDGMELLRRLRRTAPDAAVVMVTGFATVGTAVEALRAGAAHYLGKPVNLDELKKTVREVLDAKLAASPGRGPVLCFSGPPGVGKTSVGQAVAEALGREFVRLSLAGLRDEAELRGHRRTYVGAMPGRILKELARIGVSNPVFMLDEIDKIGADFRGDAASALLEILDPEQNARFSDNYLEIPFDLSRIMFIATANDVSRLPGPLLDRLENLAFPGYTDREKLGIAKDFLLPRHLRENGLSPDSITFTDQALGRIVDDYTRESGLRGLSREVGAACRRLARLTFEDKGTAPTAIDAPDIPKLLGPRRFTREAAEAGDRVGVVTGLVVGEHGGEIVFVETARMPGSGQLLLTGSLGDVLRESAQAALSNIRSRAVELGVDPDFFEKTDIHVHFPAAAITKDGPSAGVTIFCALLSLLTGRPARCDAAATGEMTLAGRLLPVAGIREKCLAAKRAGITTVVLPQANAPVVETLPADVLEGLDIVLAADATAAAEVLLRK